MDKSKFPIRDDQIDDAYQQAIRELEPSQQVEQTIKSLAHGTIQKSTDWAAFPMWARAASLTGVAIMGWWLLTPNSQQEMTPELDLLQVPGMSEDLIDGGVESQKVDTESAQRMEPAMVAPLHTAKAAPEQQALTKEQASRAKPTFRQCLQTQLEQNNGLNIEPGLPQGVAQGQLEWAQILQWQGYEWRAVKQGRDWYLVSSGQQGWEKAKLPEDLVQKCLP